MATKKGRRAGPQTAKRAARGPYSRELDRASEPTERSRKGTSALGNLAHRPMTHRQGR